MSLDIKISSLFNKIKKPVLLCVATALIYGSNPLIKNIKPVEAKQAPQSAMFVYDGLVEEQNYRFDEVLDIDEKTLEDFSINTENEAYFFNPRELRKNHDIFKLLTQKQRTTITQLTDHYKSNGEVTNNDYAFLVRKRVSDETGEKSIWYFGVKFDELIEPTGKLTIEKYGVWQVSDEEAGNIINERLREAKEWVNEKFKNAYKTCKGVDFSYNESVFLFKDKTITVSYRGKEVPFIDYLSTVLSENATWHGKHLEKEQIRNGIESLVDRVYEPEEKNLELNDEPFDVGTVHYEATKLEKHGSYYRVVFIKRDPGGKNGRLMIEFKVKRKVYDDIVKKFKEATVKLYGRYGNKLLDF